MIQSSNRIKSFTRKIDESILQYFQKSLKYYQLLSSTNLHFNEESNLASSIVTMKADLKQETSTQKIWEIQKMLVKQEKFCMLNKKNLGWFTIANFVSNLTWPN